MRNLKNSLFYLVVTGGFTALMYWIVVQGKLLEVGRKIVSPSSTDSQWTQFLSSLYHNLQHPLALLLFQIITIVLVARIFGWIFRKIGQPSVIGEIIAGIVLGPSLFGLYFPDMKDALFPLESLGNLQMLSQVGLILFMFVIGMELDLKALKNKANEAVVISHASIVIPFALGIGLSYLIYPNFVPKDIDPATGVEVFKIPFLSFSLFMGIAMSITAFPVLARIVQERGIHKTKLGTIVITCAATDDITAWCILAAVIALVKSGSPLSALYTIAFTILYILVMLKIIRPILDRLVNIYSLQEKMRAAIIASLFVMLLISSYISSIIGIHSLFGAFIAGVIMPTNFNFRKIVIDKIEDVSIVLLLPLFFVITGLKTQIGLLNTPHLWITFGWILLVAIIGKFGGSSLAAKMVGQTWKDSLSIGVLMNTRGLMQLIVLNIGYDLGILSPEIFAMMILMAVVTTFMTIPALDLIQWLMPDKNKKKEMK